MKEQAEWRQGMEQLASALDRLATIKEAALIIDWHQVVLNGGPPCFHICEGGHFCGRAQAWPGHDADHKFISLYALLDGIAPT